MPWSSLRCWSKTASAKIKRGSTCPAKLLAFPTRSSSASAPCVKRSIASAKDCFWPKRSEEHTTKLKSLLRNSYAVFGLKKKHEEQTTNNTNQNTSQKS